MVTSTYANVSKSWNRKRNPEEEEWMNDWWMKNLFISLENITRVKIMYWSRVTKSRRVDSTIFCESFSLVDFNVPMDT